MVIGWSIQNQVAQVEKFQVILGLNNSASDQYYISPMKVYGIQATKDTLPVCQSKSMCSIEATFSWMARGSCRANFICSTLTGEVCADYGITVGIQGPPSAGSNGTTNLSPLRRSICYSDYIDQGNITNPGQFSVNLWYHNDTEDFTTSCYFWCSETGQIVGQGSSSQSSSQTVSSEKTALLLITIEKVCAYLPQLYLSCN